MPFINLIYKTASRTHAAEFLIHIIYLTLYMVKSKMKVCFAICVLALLAETCTVSSTFFTAFKSTAGGFSFRNVILKLWRGLDGN
jgi:hypothetical protein